MTTVIDSKGIVGAAINPTILVSDNYAIPVFSFPVTLTTINLPSSSHIGVSYFVIAHATLVFSEPAGVPDTIGITITLDGAQPYLSFNAANNPTNGFVATPVGPFTNSSFVTPTIWWATSLSDLGGHTMTLMAGSTGGTINTASSSFRLVVMPLGS